MKKINEIILSDKEISRLRNKHVGSGTEADVYRAPNGLLFKLYKPYDVLAEEFNFCDEKEIKSTYSDTNIMLAMERQPYVTLSSLPVCPLYEKNHIFIGCAVKEHILCFPIQCISMLPRRIQIRIFKRLLRAIKELCDNNIYHRDLVTKEIDGKKHTNVLVSLLGKPETIDLDGRSTIYTTTKNENYENTSYASLTALINEILFDLDSEDDRGCIDIEWEIGNLTAQGIPYNIALGLLRCECGYEALDEVLSRILRN